MYKTVFYSFTLQHLTYFIGRIVAEGGGRGFADLKV